VSLPLSPPVAPQLARSRSALPEGDRWAYERKWDGFRALAFVDGEDVYLQSRNGRPLRRYFPELSFPPGEYVLDGEVVVRDARGKEDFDAEPIELAPLVWTAGDAQEWLQGAEGVIAKEREAPYKPGERTGMVKVKRVRTIDCVVQGYRPGKAENTVGSLILGLYADDDRLCVVGHSSGFSAKEKRELVATLQPYETGERGSGDPSRWANERDLEWVALRPELVVEITFDHVSGRRIRHGAKVQRWREDKDPRECRIEQLDS
jgi:ATP-dependent DNA ligase